MNIFLIVSIGLSLTQIVTLGWLARRTTRANRNIENLTTQCVGYTAALDCHERRLDLLTTNHNSSRQRHDATWFKLQTLDNTVHAHSRSLKALENLVEDLCDNVDVIDGELEDTIAEVTSHETAVERQFRGINGAIDHFDDVLIQKGGGL